MIMTPRIHQTTSALLLAFALFGSLLLGPAMTLAPAQAADTAVATATQTAMAEISIDNFTFSPAEITVPVGATVTWTNKDDIPHLVVEKSGAFRSKALDTDDKFSRTFDQAGVVDYYCGMHPHMIGRIIVKAQ
jgi:plastocyanin